MTANEVVAVRCDKDRTVMVKVRVSYSDSQFEGPAFKCADPDCMRYFSDGRGYFDVIDGQVLAEKFQQRCPMCRGPMYLRETEQDVEIWRCPTPSCGHEQRMVA